MRNCPLVDMYYLHASNLLDIRANDLILDVGCSKGIFSEMLAQKSKWTVAIDVRIVALLETKKRGIDVVKASAVYLPFRNEIFDKVSTLEVIEHLEHGQELACLQEIYYVLKARGSAVLTTPNKGRLYQYIFLDPAFCLKHKHFSKLGIKDLLTSAGFKTKEIYTSGGFVHIVAFYSLYWRLETFTLLTPLLELLRKVAIMEFSTRKSDGSTIIAFAQK